jgi:PadR family transcriptional regulator, regulatory protein PadR
MGVRFRRTPALLAVLQVLLHADRTYGLEIIERTGLPSGTVYPLLARLEIEGWVTSYWETDDAGARGPRKRFYEITVTGAENARTVLAGQRPATSGTGIAGPVRRQGLAGGHA